MATGGVDGAGPRPLAPVSATRPLAALGDTRQESVARLARLDVGQQYQAQIVSRLSDGSFAVQIADTTARLALPDGGKPGDRLALTLLATEPRPTFSLDAQEAAATGAAGGPGTAASVAGARLAQALAAASLPSAADGADSAAHATLSDTGRLVALLSGGARDGATALVGSVPLAAAGAAAPQLASALHDTLSFSGLFYESHVQQWAQGERPLADLLREPQARGSNPSDAAGGVGAATLAGTAPPEVQEARRNLLAYADAASSPAGAQGAGGIAALDPAAAQLVGLQLQTLEQQRVQWHGELWPGQPMSWEVRRGGPDEQGSSPDTAPEQEAWQSVVRFAMTGLGTVSATIDLTGDRVRIQVRTDSDAATAALRSNAPALASALDVAGTTLENLQIRRAAEGTGAADTAAAARAAQDSTVSRNNGNP